MLLLTTVYFLKWFCHPHVQWRLRTCSGKNLVVLKTCVHYFSLFLKEQCASWLFRTKYFEKKFNLLLFYLPTVSWTFFSSGLPRATHLIETSSEKITACVIETILVTLPLVPMNKARRKVSQQIKYNSTQDKIATVLRAYLNDWKNVLPLFKL